MGARVAEVEIRLSDSASDKVVRVVAIRSSPWRNCPVDHCVRDSAICLAVSQNKGKHLDFSVQK